MRQKAGHSMMRALPSTHQQKLPPMPTAPPYRHRERQKRRLIRALRSLEHPGWNLQPASGVRAAQRATENNAIRLVDLPWTQTRRPNHGCHRYKSSRNASPVGVLKPCCTTRSERICPWAKTRQAIGRSNSSASSPRGRSSAAFITNTTGYSSRHGQPRSFLRCRQSGTAPASR